MSFVGVSAGSIDNYDGLCGNSPCSNGSGSGVRFFSISVSDYRFEKIAGTGDVVFCEKCLGDVYRLGMKIRSIKRSLLAKGF